MIERKTNHSIRSAFIDSIPILWSFISLGFGFGYIGHQLGIEGHLIVFMAAVIYAGSAEFLVINMLAKFASMTDIIMATSLVNLRHIFYGLSVQHQYPKHFLKRMYMIHTLTDETYSILATKIESDPVFSFWLAFFNHIYWVIGVALGVTIGAIAGLKIDGLEFCLTALFIVLTIEQAWHIKRWFPFIIAMCASTVSLIIFPKQMLLTSMILVTVMLILAYHLMNDK